MGSHSPGQAGESHVHSVRNECGFPGMRVELGGVIFKVEKDWEKRIKWAVYCKKI